MTLDHPGKHPVRDALGGLHSKRISIAIAALSIAIGLAGTAPRVVAQDPEPKTDLADVADEVMCTVCGVPLDQATEAPQAIAERDFIRRLVDQGRTKDEIKDALVAQYGENVLAIPGDEGFDLAAWLVPALAFLTAALGIGIALRRWRHAPVTEGADGSAEPTQTGESERSAERLDEDMARYRL